MWASNTTIKTTLYLGPLTPPHILVPVALLMIVSQWSGQFYSD